MQRNEISTYNRSVRLQNKSPTSAICSLETGPGSGSGELILDEVDERTRVGISALLSLASGIEKDPNGRGNSPGGCTNLANPELVSITHPTSNCTTNVATSREGVNSHTTTLRSPSSTCAIPAPSGLEALRHRYRAAGISEEAATVLLASCRDSVHNQYESAWRAWSGWCRERSIDLVSTPVNSILDFLVSREKEGLAYRSLAVCRSAISLYHNPIDSKPVAGTSG